MNPYFPSCGHDENLYTKQSNDNNRNTIIPCGVCRTSIIGTHFSCSQCSSFNLHPFCKTRPPTLSSTLHPKHALSLVTSSSSVSAPTRLCDVCFEPVRGLFYTCLDRRCDFDVHPQCSQICQRVRHALDPRHVLELQHRGPRTTRCNVCGGDCAGWGYRCGVCSIDLHYWCLLKPVGGLGGTTTRRLLPDQQPFYFGYPNFNGYSWPGNNYGYHNAGGGSGNGNGTGSGVAAMNISGSLAVNLLSNLAANLIQNGFLFG